MVDERDDLRRLLEEIRDVTREHLAEYKRVTQQSLELQERAVRRQEQIGRTYQWAAAIGGVMIIGIVALIVYLMGLLSSYV